MINWVMDRVKETTATSGTGPLTLAGAVAIDGGYVRLGSFMGIGDTCDYGIKDAVANAWETGRGTYTALNTLTRTTIYSSSNGGAAVSLAGNAATEVFLTLTAAAIVGLTLKIGAMAAAGTTQGTAAPITFNTTILTACVAGANGVILVAGFPVSDIRNRGTVAALIYPILGEQMEFTAGINLPASIPAGNNACPVRDTSTTPATWRI